MNPLKELKKELVIRPKKCMICEFNNAQYFIKGSPKDRYCTNCALQKFNSIDCLEKIKSYP
ncbi:hypothetical protein GF327_01780 [Candidatus Woesearchaeota archaeon]|nr:hypothetical protein [Candidatus Woesearchaeota archaeon]